MWMVLRYIQAHVLEHGMPFQEFPFLIVEKLVLFQCKDILIPLEN